VGTKAPIDQMITMTARGYQRRGDGEPADE
jgi:hypothetical protein